MSLPLILTAYAVACAIVPFLICRALPPRENRSREIARYLEQRDSHSQPHGDWPSVSFDFTRIPHDRETTV